MTSFLVPPGMGDIYWPLTKLQSFVEKKNLGRPEVTIWEINDTTKINGKPRSEDYLKRFHWLDYKGWKNLPLDEVWWSFYSKPLRPAHDKPKWIHENHKGFDYVLHLNGVLECERTLNDTELGLDKYDTNWFLDQTPPQEELQATEEYKNRFDRYIVLYFSGLSLWQQEYFKSITHQQMYEFIRDLSERTGATKIIATGVHWDAGSYNKLMEFDKDDLIVDFTNQTNINQLLGLFKGSIGVFGMHSGNTMEAVIQKIPTVMMFTKPFDRWPPGFIKNHLPPDSYGNWFNPYYIEDLLEQRDEILNFAEKVFK